MEKQIQTAQQIENAEVQPLGGNFVYRLPIGNKTDQQKANNKKRRNKIGSVERCLLGDRFSYADFSLLNCKIKIYLRK